MDLSSTGFYSGQITSLYPPLTSVDDYLLDPTTRMDSETDQTAESPSAQAEEVAFLNQIISTQKTNIADLINKIEGLHVTIQFLSKNLEEANERESARKLDQEVLQKFLVDLQANRQTMQSGLISMEGRMLRLLDEMKEKEKKFMHTWEKKVGKKDCEVAQRKIKEDAEFRLNFKKISEENGLLKLELFQLRSHTQALMSVIEMLRSYQTLSQ